MIFTGKKFAKRLTRATVKRPINRVVVPFMLLPLCFYSYSCSKGSPDEKAGIAPNRKMDKLNPDASAKSTTSNSVNDSKKPEQVPKPRGIKIIREEKSGPSGRLVIYAVSRKKILNQIVPYLEYLASSRNAKDASVYLFDREDKEAGVPLEPVDYFRFFIGELKIKNGKGVFIENPDYFKDDGDVTPNGDEIDLAFKIWHWRKKNHMEELGHERESAEAFAKEKGLDPHNTWLTYAKVLDDSISLGEKHFLKQEDKLKHK